jgi:hemolysin III
MKKSLPTPRTKLRGWFHQESVPFVMAAGIVLVVLSPTTPKRIGALVYLLSSVLLFKMSSIYHMFNWSAKTKGILRKIDHSNVFLIIAGTNTPIIISYLPASFSKLLLFILWGVVVIGILFQIFYTDAPRILQVSIYIGLGLGGFSYMPYIIKHYHSLASTVTFFMIIAGGVLYIAGAIFYATKWPGKNAKIFGFHELFHIFTILAFACHCVAVYYAVLGT